METCHRVHQQEIPGIYFLEKSWERWFIEVIKYAVHRYKSFQVLIKIKSKHVGGALSKKQKGKVEMDK
jgi:hypothetical protein